VSRPAPISARVLGRAALIALAALSTLGATRARAQSAPAPSAPVQTAPSQSAPVQTAPVKAAPAQPAAKAEPATAESVKGEPAKADPAKPAASGSTASGSVAAGADKPAAPAEKIAEGFEMGELDARSIPLGGALTQDDAVWQEWKRRFLTDQGRVVDTANGQMSHSEGQGYGMALAVAAADRVAFERIWAWTRANLMVRPDELVAWRWEPDKRAGIGDVNNASDGDILIAWALTEAAEFWGEVSYRIAGRRIAVEVSRKTFLLKTAFGAIILPAVLGFTGEERPDGPVVNLSYWVFPALERLKIVAPEVDWKGVTQSGLDLLKAARFGKEKLPPDWLSLKDGKPAPAQNFPVSFGYDAIRAPLYMAFAGIGERDHYAPFVALWRGGAATRKLDLATGAGEALPEGGYRAPSALVLCAATGAKFPPELRRAEANEHYYPATLRLLALAGARMRYPACLQS
jgi:endoglucanase